MQLHKELEELKERNTTLEEVAGQAEYFASLYQVSIIIEGDVTFLLFGAIKCQTKWHVLNVAKCFKKHMPSTTGIKIQKHYQGKMLILKFLVPD